MSDTVKHKILSYLAQRPRAMDTVDGIALYWVEADIEEVERALDELVVSGSLVTYSHAGRVYYRAVTGRGEKPSDPGREP